MADSWEPLGLSRSGSSEPKANILLVGDNPANLLSLRPLLDDLGQNVVEAHSGDEAIQRVRADDYAVVLLDVLMPGLSGFETARAMEGHKVACRLRQRPGLEDVVLAALTGWGQQEDRRRSAEAGFNHHLVKPPEPKALESVLASLPKKT